MLSATRWCADRMFRAVVRALRFLSFEQGCIAVAAAVTYHDGKAPRATGRGLGDAPIHFRLTCDARTGSFAACFSRQCKLLLELAGNCLAASEPMSLRIASLPRSRRPGATSSGQAVRDAFQGLIRSMNLLGQRVGVGGTASRPASSGSARSERPARTPKCRSPRPAVLYGLSAVAIGAALGMEAVHDMYVKIIRCRRPACRFAEWASMLRY